MSGHVLSKAGLWQQIAEILPWLIQIRRDFHRYPELGLEEYRTRDKIVEYLEEMDIAYQTGIAGTGVVGLIEGEGSGKTVALRADMDALPIREQNNVAYKSIMEGKMHACGHDAHMTIQLGAAKILQANKDKLRGKVKLLFQPAEETVGGAKPMIEQGVLENPRVEAIFGLHMDPDLQVGEMAIKYGQMNASSDTIKITILGEQAHGAYPHQGRDAIVIAAQVINSLQTIVSRGVDPRESAVISIGVIAGGTQGNIVADRVNLTGTVRTLNAEVRQMVLSRLEEVVHYVSKSMGGDYLFQVEEGYTSLVNDQQMVELVRNSGTFLLGQENVFIDSLPSLGVEDFAFFAEKVPAAFYRLGCGNKEKGIIHSIHHPCFNIDEECLKIGAALQVQNVINYLTK